jgi:hypothetical protein
MRKTLQIAVLTVVWLLASPALHIPDSAWLEVGPPSAMANEVKPSKKIQKPLKRVVRSSAPIPASVAPGLYPMQPIVTPETPAVTGSVTMAQPVAGYPQVPTVPVLGRETSQDRVSRCAHQAALGGLPSGEQGAYIHSCAFN